MFEDPWALMIPGVVGLVVGWFAGHRFGLDWKKWPIALVSATLFVGLYIGLDVLTQARPIDSDMETSIEDENLPETILPDQPPIDQGLSPFDIDATTFRTRFNAIIESRFPDEVESLTLPPPIIETGLISDAFRHRIDRDIRLTGGVRKGSGRIEEITMVATNDLPPERIREIQHLAIAAVGALSGSDAIIDHEIGALFIEATSRPSHLAKRSMGDMRLTAMMDSMAGLVFTVSRPVSLPSPPPAPDPFEVAPWTPPTEFEP